MKELTNKINVFNTAREWDQFHTPKNLAISLSLEAAELLQEFQWTTDENSYNFDSAKIDQIKDEIGDITIYLLNICDKLNIDPIECANQKLIKNEKKYPIHLSKGNSKKYNEF